MKHISFFVILLQIISINIKAQYLDGTFGNSGIIITDDNYHAETGYAIALQTDGKIVVAGNTVAGTIEDFLVIRYNTDGSIDISFGNNGFCVIDFGNTIECAYGIDIQSDNKIVVCGYTELDSDHHERFATMRLNSDGSLDSTFNLTGKRIDVIGFDNYAYDRKAYDVEVQSDGTIIVGGTSNEDYAFIKYSSDGTPFSAFGGNGKVEYDLNGNYGEEAYTISITDDNKIFAGGSSYRVCTTEIGIIRLNSDGSIDNSFGWNGQLIADFNNGSEYALAMELQADGKILTAGFHKDTSGHYDIEVIRYTQDGDIDNTFGTNGFVVHDFGYDESKAFAIAIEDNGDIIVAGSFGSSSQFSVGLVRFKTDGTLDNSFGVNGIIVSDITSSSRDRIRALLIQPDGKYLAAGYAVTNSFDFLVLRYLSQNNKVIDINQGVLNSRIYPNPTNELIFNLEYEIKKEQFVKIELTDIGGNLINQLQNEKSVVGKYNKQLTLPAKLQTGCYFVRITTEQNVFSHTLVINNN